MEVSTHPANLNVAIPPKRRAQFIFIGKMKTKHLKCAVTFAQFTFYVLPNVFISAI